MSTLSLHVTDNGSSLDELNNKNDDTALSLCGDSTDFGKCILCTWSIFESPYSTGILIGVQKGCNEL